MPNQDDSRSPQASTSAHPATAGRASPDQIKQLASMTLDEAIVQALLEASQGFLLILDEHRQILAANQEFLEVLRADSPDHFLGMRPGEVLGCIFSNIGPDGCGTSDHCPSCGAMIAITASQVLNQPVVGECRLSMTLQGKFEARDFRVRASPLLLSGNRVIAVIFTDISSSKRREILEQVFVHDLLNTVGGLFGLAEMLGKEIPNDEKMLLMALCERLQSEVKFHHALLSGEKGTLRVENTPVKASEVFSDIQHIFAHHRVTANRKLIITPPAQDLELVTDHGLLVKVLGNMVKNAFEAIPSGEAVRVSFEEHGNAAGFVVHNPGLIPEEIQKHIFERSYTTKGTPGRGIGTYSMKLFGERYLSGNVAFSSSAADGTTFSIFLSTKPPPAIAQTPMNKQSATTPNPFAEDKPASKAVPETKVSDGLNILLIEDDDSVLHLEKLLLEHLGHRVFPFEDPVKALEIFLLSPEGFDLVLTDYSMSPFNGTKLAKKIHEINPDMPILLATEFNEPITMKDAKSYGIRKVLRKPFTSRELGETIQQIRQLLRKR